MNTPETMKKLMSLVQAYGATRYAQGVTGMQDRQLESTAFPEEQEAEARLQDVARAMHAALLQESRSVGQPVASVRCWTEPSSVHPQGRQLYEFKWLVAGNALSAGEYVLGVVGQVPQGYVACRHCGHTVKNRECSEQESSSCTSMHAPHEATVGAGTSARELVEAGWQAALDCHSQRGMAGWSSHRNHYLQAALADKEKTHG